MELSVLTTDEIEASTNRYLKSFSSLLNGKTQIRTYHLKALEVAALEIQNAQLLFKNTSIGAIVFDICRSDLGGNLNLSAIFSS